MTRTYTPPPWNARAEAAYQSAPRTICLGLAQTQSPDARSYTDSQTPTPERPVPTPARNRPIQTKTGRPNDTSAAGRVRQVIAVHDRPTPIEVYRVLGCGTGLNRKTVLAAIGNLVQAGHVRRLPNDRLELTEHGQALAEGRV